MLMKTSHARLRCILRCVPLTWVSSKLAPMKSLKNSGGDGGFTCSSFQCPVSSISSPFLSRFPLRCDDYHTCNTLEARRRQSLLHRQTSLNHVQTMREGGE
ncbi:hypothetical protein RB213_016004, partial [Colletotrichum asianum]